VREFIGVLVGRLRGWVVGTALVARFVGVSAGVGLWLLGVPLALTFGLLAGFLDIILLFGSVVGGALPATKIEARLDPVLLEIEQRIEDLRANQD
jgi:predicted PurR-regulated permease PerM